MSTAKKAHMDKSALQEDLLSAQQPAEAILNCYILIIEDDYIGRELLCKIFEKRGFQTYPYRRGTAMKGWRR